MMPAVEEGDPPKQITLTLTAQEYLRLEMLCLFAEADVTPDDLALSFLLVDIGTLSSRLRQQGYNVP